VSRHQNKGQVHYIRIANKFFEKAAKLKYLGRAIISGNWVHEEIKIRFGKCNSEYFCLPVCHVKT
jgi:hypothetical protein